MENANEKGQHTNIYCLILIGITALSFILNIFFYVRDMPEFLDLLFLTVILLVTLLLVMDREALKASYPEQKIFTGITVFFVPWYLYARAKFLRNKQWLLLIWAIVVAIGMSADYWVEKTYNWLPTCEDQRVTEWLGEKINNVGGAFISLTEIEQLSFDEFSEVRICKSILTQEDDVRTFYYTVYWENRSHAYYRVDVVPRWEYE